MYWLTSVSPVLALPHRDSLQWLCYLSHPSSSSLLCPWFPAELCQPSSQPAPHSIPSCSAPLCPHLVHPVETRTLACLLPWGLYFSPWYNLSHSLSFPVHYLFKHTIHILPQWGLAKSPAWEMGGFFTHLLCICGGSFIAEVTVPGTPAISML